jgi:hypothetical protein
VFLFLRILGVTNAAIWFGAAVFFTVAIGPAFFSNQMLSILPRSHAGAAAQIVLEYYFSMHQWCGGIAVVHLIGEWLYASKPLRRWILYLVLALFGLGLLGGQVFQPKLKKLHLEMYGLRSTEQQRTQAKKSFDLWHGVAQTTNLLMALGLFAYLLQVTSPGVPSRFAAANKFRG